MYTIVVEEGATLALLPSYLAMIEASIGSRQYQRLYVEKGEVNIDVIDDGSFACAFFVSSVLTLFNLTKGGVHTTVTQTERDLIESDWCLIESPEPGCVVIWKEKLCSDGVLHRHIGFALDETRAVSTDPVMRTPQSHHLTYGCHKDNTPFRSIVALYLHPKLMETEPLFVPRAVAS